MNAPDPKAWEVTDRECEELSWPGGAQAVAELVARRRAIAELWAIVEFMKENEYDYTVDFAEEVRDRIAAIEAESAESA